MHFLRDNPHIFHSVRFRFIILHHERQGPIALFEGGRKRLRRFKQSFLKKPVLCIAGSLDVHTPPELHCLPLERAIQARDGVMFHTVSYPTDHFFSDCRETVAKTVESFLLEQLSIEKS